jgi:FkbM family methyltransferase
VITDTTLRSSSMLGRLARLPLRLVSPEAEMRILRGPLRGRRWIAGSSSHGCWLGTYEAAVLEEFAARVGPGAVVYDVGANVGLFSLLAAARGSRAIAFEPDARNRAFLERHLEINRMSDRVQIVAAAVGRSSGRARYEPDRSGLEGRVDPNGREEIEMVALDQLDLPDPTVLKIDVEGAELDVLVGAVELLRRSRPLVFLETHDDREGSCRELIEGLGYRMRSLGDARRFLAEPAA